MYDMKVNKQAKTIKLTGQKVKLLGFNKIRTLENAGWTITVIIKGESK